jgi:hypothetical protein
MYVLCVRTRIVVATSATVSGSRIEGFYAVSSFASSMISYIGGLPSKSRPFAYCIVLNCAYKQLQCDVNTRSDTSGSLHECIIAA